MQQQCCTGTHHCTQQRIGLRGENKEKPSEKQKQASTVGTNVSESKFKTHRSTSTHTNTCACTCWCMCDLKLGGSHTKCKSAVTRLHVASPLTFRLSVNKSACRMKRLHVCNVTVYIFT